jgi:anti-sigma B factor antagonist
MIKITAESVEVAKVSVRVLRIVGRLTLGEGTSNFRETIRQELKNNFKFFALDLSGLNYIDASGFGELVSSFTVVNRAGGETVYFALTKRVLDLFGVAKLCNYICVKPDEAAALREFEKQPAGGSDSRDSS